MFEEHFFDNFSLYFFYLALFMLLFLTAKIAKEYAKVAINSPDFAFFAKKICVPCGKAFFRIV